MRIQKAQIDKQTVTQVFMSNEEANQEECKKRIDELKNENGNVVVFCAGNRSLEDSFKYMLQFLKNKVEVN